MLRFRVPWLAIASGLLLWLAWPPLPLIPLLFVAFVPLLWLEEARFRKHISFKSYILWTYIGLLLWNLLTTWWIAATYFGTRDPATAIAGLLANVANPLLMCLPMAAFHFTRLRFGDRLGYAAFVAYWLAFEFLHLRWELAWPWLTLGYGLAKAPQLYQWYEYTGPLGGSLWILTVNVLVFRLQQQWPTAQRPMVLALPAMAVLLLPALASWWCYGRYQARGSIKNVVVVQPNVDPYSEKFDPGTLKVQLLNLIHLAASKADSSTDYIVFPETAIPYGIFLNELHTDASLLELRKFLRNYPQARLITGIHAYARYDHRATPTARRSQDGTYYWDAFNTAIQLDTSQSIPYYHKSKLVPGVERMPYPELLRFLEPLALNLGGITGSLGSQPYRTVFFSADSTGVAPLIC
ncbi:MAG: apolipoprotein N-acyltransferase, partial [Chitinophagales bacterium]|nr:apolipoprotein N-acyltransferase [Chitinophagales bacterium]MDW8427764.1 nitrilase-related carbon-nitrogen hydrolase [Chitinophagales bacterium]